MFANYAQQIEQGMSGCPIGAGSVFGAAMYISPYMNIPPPPAGMGVGAPSPTPTTIKYSDGATTVVWSTITYEVNQ